MSDLIERLEALLVATNKLAFFQHFQDKDYVPPFWTNQEDIWVFENIRRGGKPGYAQNLVRCL